MQTKGQLKLKLSAGVEGSSCSVPEKGLGALRRDLQVESMQLFLVQTQGLSSKKYQEVLQGCESLKPWIPPASSACWHAQPCCPFHNVFDLSVTHLKAFCLHQQGASGLSHTHVSVLVLYPVISYSFHSEGAPSLWSVNNTAVTTSLVF